MHINAANNVDKQIKAHLSSIKIIENGNRLIIYVINITKIMSIIRHTKPVTNFFKLSR
jgi:hypothetical protein